MRTASPRHWDIRTKVVALATGTALVTGAAMAGVSAWQSDRFASTAETDVAELVDQDITRTADGAYDVVATQGASTSAMVDSSLAVAGHVVAEAGGFGVGGGTVHWEAKNQLSD